MPSSARNEKVGPAALAPTAIEPPGPGQLSRRTVALALAAICLLALGLRIAHLVVVQREELLHVPAMSADAAFNDEWARQAVGGEPVLEGWPYYVSPLYIEYLRGLYGLFGPEPLVARIIQIVLGSLTPLLLYWITRRFADRRAGLAAALLGAAYPLFVFYEPTLIKASLSVFAASGAMAMVLLAAQARRRRVLLWLAAGVATGVLCLIRSNVLLFAPLAAVTILWFGRRQLRPALLHCAAWAVGIAAAIAPVTIRNAAVCGEFVLINANGGFSFFVCQRPGAAAFFVPISDVEYTPAGEARDARALAERAVGRDLSAAEVSQFYFDQGWEHIKRDPGRAFRRTVDKAMLALNSLEVPNTEDFYLARSLSPVLKLPLGFGVVLPLGVWGLVLCWRRRASVFVNLFLLANFVSLAMFYVSDRYRLPAVPMLIVYAGVAAIWLWDRLGERAWRRLVPAAVVIVVLLWVSGLPLVKPDPRKDLTRTLPNAATYYLWKGEHARGLELLQRVEDAGKGDAEIAELMAHAELSLGNPAAAFEHLTRAIRRDPDRVSARMLRAEMLLKAERAGEAAADLRRVLQIEPNNARAAWMAGMAARRAGRLDEARRLLERARLGLHTAGVYGELALTCAAQGDRAAAGEAVAEGLRRYPDDARLQETRRSIEGAAQTAPASEGASP